MQGLVRLAVKQERLTKTAVLRRSGGILKQSPLQLGDRAIVIFLRHVSAGKAAMALLPLRLFAVKLVQFRDGSVVVADIAISIRQIVANRGFIGSDAQGRTIFRDRLTQIALFMQGKTQIRMRLPESGTELNGMMD